MAKDAFHGVMKAVVFIFIPNERNKLLYYVCHTFHRTMTEGIVIPPPDIKSILSLLLEIVLHMC
jgi:hypothetical protein